MPIYEFHCDDCDKNFESLIMIASAAENLRCKYCKSSNIKKWSLPLHISRQRGVVSLLEPFPGVHHVPDFPERSGKKPVRLLIPYS